VDREILVRASSGDNTVEDLDTSSCPTDEQLAEVVERQSDMRAPSPLGVQLDLLLR
jgi:hypothetical protein